MAGWETQLGRDFTTGKYLGFCGLANKGFSLNRPPKDIDYQRTRLVKEFIDLWALELIRGGVPEEKLYSHIVFTIQGLDDEKRVARASYEEKVHFSTPDVAFGDVYRPGFSTYPTPGTFVGIYEQLQANGNPPWASAEGTNIIPNGAPGERSMETYLGRMFNHGAVLVNIFSWASEAKRKGTPCSAKLPNDPRRSRAIGSSCEESRWLRIRPCLCRCRCSERSFRKFTEAFPPGFRMPANRLRLKH